MLHDNAGQLVATSIAWLIISFPTTLLRCFVRIKNKNFGVDDWLMCLGMAIFILLCTTTIMGAYAGFGAHRLNIPDQVLALKLFFYWSIVYILATIFIKLSILWTLRRIAEIRVYRYSIDGAGVLIVVFALTSLINFIGGCTPVAFHWDTSIPGGKCENASIAASLSYVYSAICILTDWFCAILPVFLLWNVQMNFKTKASVALILGLGAFASTATMIRLKFVVSNTQSADLFFGAGHVALWSIVECGIGITAGSFATLRPLFRTLHLGSSAKNSQLNSAPSRRNTFFGDSTEQNKASGPIAAEDTIELQGREPPSTIYASGSSAWNESRDDEEQFGANDDHWKTVKDGDVAKREPEPAVIAREMA